MSYWLLKSEPGTFSIDDLAASPKKTTAWDGVRNYQARNFIRDGMKKGDLAFFYHSSCPVPGIVGIVEIASAAYPDETAFDPEEKYYDPKSERDNPRWFAVDVKLKRKLKKQIDLGKLKQYAGDRLSDMKLLQRGNRLSVMPVSKKHWQFINSLE
ncbi:MAG: EVE domain-containing protein [Gammaproteobacteria bacterium]|nr:EVE domain-containing protein [Gammaproteobacteria bacterium]